MQTPAGEFCGYMAVEAARKARDQGRGEFITGGEFRFHARLTEREMRRVPIVQPGVALGRGRNDSPRRPVVPPLRGLRGFRIGRLEDDYTEESQP